MRFPRVNDALAFPLPNDELAFPLPPWESVFFNPGTTKRVLLGSRGYPYGELSINPSTDLTQIEYKQDGGAYAVVTAGDYPDIIQAARYIPYDPTVFNAASLWWIKATLGALIREEYVSVITDVWAGVNKVARINQAIRPFADASFCADTTLLGTVTYQIDGEVAETLIPASWGTELMTRVYNFELRWATAGVRRVTLNCYDTASPANIFSDSVIVRVGGSG